MIAIIYVKQRCSLFMFTNKPRKSVSQLAQKQITTTITYLYLTFHMFEEKTLLPS